MNSRFCIPFILLVWLLIPVTEAQAYIDPGAGSILLQAVIGGLAAALALGASYWTRIRSALFRRSNQTGSQEHD